MWIGRLHGPTLELLLDDLTKESQLHLREGMLHATLNTDRPSYDVLCPSGRRGVRPSRVSLPRVRPPSFDGAQPRPVGDTAIESSLGSGSAPLAGAPGVMRQGEKSAQPIETLGYQGVPRFMHMQAKGNISQMFKRFGARHKQLVSPRHHESVLGRSQRESWKRPLKMSSVCLKQSLRHTRRKNYRSRAASHQSPGL